MKKQTKLIQHFNNQKTEMLSMINGGTGGPTYVQRQVGTAPASYIVTSPDSGRGAIRFSGDNQNT